ADERKADVLAVLVAVAHDDAVLARARQHREQLRFGTGFEPEALAAVLKQGVHDAALLVHLDGIHGGVTPAVALSRDGAVERLAQLAYAMMQDPRKAHEYGQRKLHALELARELVQVDTG